MSTMGKGWIGNVITGYVKLPTGEVMPQLGEKVLIDFLKAFVWFICGKRGGGKSYLCNVIMEEILLQNPTLGTIILDPMGLYFGLKYPNTNMKEYRGWEGKVTPQGFADRVRIMVPIGWKDKYPADSYDGTIGIRPCDLSNQNWFDCLKIENATPQGNALSIFLEKVRKINPNFTIDQFVHLIERVAEVGKNPSESEDDEAKEVFSENEITFRGVTIETLQSKIMATVTWGIFSSKSIDIFDICQAGIITILDLSWHQIPQEVGALLVGFLTERLFELRKMRSAERMHAEVGEQLDYLKTNKELPPPVLVVEEAHNYLGKSRKTAFSVASFKKYIKQGRQAGCSLITVTQQPQDMDTSPLSQINGCISFSISYKGDFDAVQNVMPTELPRNWKMDLRGLHIGEAIVAFADQTAYKKVRIRPRHSIHLATSETTSILDLKTNLLATQETSETENVPPLDLPKVIQKPEDITEVQRLVRENVALRVRFDALKEEKNETIQSKEDRINELVTKVTELQSIVDMKKDIEKHGIILAKFDNSQGYIADYEMSSEKMDAKVLHDIAQSAIGLGETISNLNFQLEREMNYFCFSKRFNREDAQARGGKTLYAVVIFTTNEANQFESKFLDRIIEEITQDWSNHTKIIDKYFAQVFFSVQGLRQAVLFYKSQLDDAKRRIKSLVTKREEIEGRLKGRIETLMKEKHTLSSQLENMSNVFNFEKPEVRAILLEEKFGEINQLSEELERIKEQIEVERRKHGEELDECKQIIVDLDRNLERSEQRIEQQFMEDVKVEQRIHQVQATIIGSNIEDISAYIEKTGLKPFIEQLFQSEKERYTREMQDADGAIKGYREGLVHIKTYINRLKEGHKIKLLEHEKRSLEILKYSSQLEQEIKNLKNVITQLRPHPVETISKEEKERVFTKGEIPRELARALNPESYPAKILEIAQKLKQKLTGLDPLEYKIVSLAETVDTWITSKNMCLAIIDWKIDSIRGRLKSLLKKGFIVSRREGQLIYYRSNLKVLVRDTFKPFQGVMTGLQLDSLYMEIRESLNIQLIPVIKKQNGTLDSFSGTEGGE